MEDRILSIFDLRAHSPFFGELPSALSIVRLNRLASLSDEAGQDPLAPFCRTLARLGPDLQVRWWVGLGSSFFDDSRRSVPAELNGIRFNGDLEAGACFDQSSIALVLGGDWEQTIEATRAVKRLAEELSCELTGIELGYTGGCCRGHSGFIEGTSNLQELSDEELAECIFVENEEGGAESGSYLIFRKYEEDVGLWEDLPEVVQEQIVGRRKNSGSYLDEQTDWSPSTWDRTPAHSHIRLVNPHTKRPSWKDRIYRRSIPFTESTRKGPMRGLLFIALCRSPHEQVMRIHNAQLLPAHGPQDLLLSSGYVRPILTGIYFLPMHLSVREV